MLRVIFAGLRRGKGMDLEAVEMATRAAMQRGGAAVLRELLAMPVESKSNVPCKCGSAAAYHEMRSKQLLTVVGRIPMQRAYYVCPRCHEGQSPRDRQLDVEGTEYSPGVRRMMATVGADSSFEQGQEQLQLLAGVKVTAKAVERHAEAMGTDIAEREQTNIERALQLELPQVCGPPVPKLYVEMDGTAVPVVAAERAGRVGKIAGQPARTREVKLGCVFTQTGVDEKGRPVRDALSTTYTGAIETAEEFGRRIYTEAWERGLGRAAKVVVLGDGGVWIWNLAGYHFPGAIQIVDLYHARQHIWDVAAKLFPDQQKERKRWARKWVKKLDAGRIETLVAELSAFPVPHAELLQLLQTEAEYFQRNAERMRYPKFRTQKLFVGSGVIEAGCKTLIGVRLKQSGMFWTVRGANAIIALRCNRLSGKFENYWESRQKAA